MDEVLDAVFDSDFGLSDGASSADEDGDDVYAYLGDPVAMTDRLMIDAKDADSSINDNDSIDEDNNPTANEEPELGVGRAEMAGIDPGDGCDGDGVFPATLQETTSSLGSSCESMSTDMHELSSSDEHHLVLVRLPLLVHLHRVEEVAIPGVAECQHLDMEADMIMEGHEAVEESKDVEQQQADGEKIWTEKVKEKVEKRV